MLNGGADIEAYVDQNMIEVFINGGEFVITNAVYDLSRKVVGNDELDVMTEAARIREKTTLTLPLLPQIQSKQPVPAIPSAERFSQRFLSTDLECILSRSLRRC